MTCSALETGCSDTCRQRPDLEPCRAVHAEHDCSLLDVEEASLLTLACQELAGPGVNTRSSASQHAVASPMVNNASLGSCRNDQVVGVAFGASCAAQAGLAVAAKQPPACVSSTVQMIRLLR